MQKLSRIDKYRDYRNRLNNDGEREIATKELKELQEKIIFNEKRFGNNSRTEFDLNRGRKGTSTFDPIEEFKYESKSQVEETDYLDDIFNELNRYKKTVDASKSDPIEIHDEYINRIKDIVNRTNTHDETIVPQKETDINDKISNLEKNIINETDSLPQNSVPISNDQSILDLLPSFSDSETIDDLLSYEEKKNEESSSFFEEEEEFIEDPGQDGIEENEMKEQPADDNLYDNSYIEIKDDIQSQAQEDKVAEFAEDKVINEVPESHLENIPIKKSAIKPTIPQYDHSKEFEDICINVNSLAEEIDFANAFAQNQYNPTITNHKSSINSFEGIQQNVKKDLIGVDNTNDFFNNLDNETKLQKEDEETDINLSSVEKNESKKTITKSEISGEMKEEFDNTVSLQVDKLLGEISSSKADNISATDIINNNDKAKKDIDNYPGKTIAFEVDKKDDAPDNTIVLTKPIVDDASIRTMSFKTEDLEVKDIEKGNIILNAILSILIIIAIGALGVIVYFFLMTRGII